MKVIIADDERLARVSIRSMLSELDLPIEVVGEASNGEELVALAGRCLPDIAFVDIQMPKMNGLAGIKAATAVSPQTQWIVITGFSEFTYAQEAIRLRAVNYLLKPVSPDQLREALAPVVQLKKEWDLTANKEFERGIASFVHGLSSPDDEDDRIIFGNPHYETMIFSIDSRLDEPAAAEHQLEFCRKIREIINSLASKEIRLAMFTLPDGDLGTVCAWDGHPYFHGRRIRDYFFSLIDQLRERMTRPEFTITAFYSEEYTKMQDCLSGLSGFTEIKPLRVLLGIGCKYRRQDLEPYRHDKSLIEISTFFVEMATAYQDGNFSAYVNLIRALHKTGTQTGSVYEKYRSSWHEFLQTSIGVQSSELIGTTWYKKLEDYGESILKRQAAKKLTDTDLVERTVSYVAQNFQYDISIGQIAAKLNVTPNYLSALFHKKTGKAFMKYLTEVRMTKAKELLADPNLQIQDVAEEVGYYSARHFTKVFTQCFGCYPSEYRKGLKRDNA